MEMVPFLVKIVEKYIKLKRWKTMETENILRRHLFVINVEQNVTINSLLRGTRSVMDKSVPSHAISVTRNAGIKIN